MSVRNPIIRLCLVAAAVMATPVVANALAGHHPYVDQGPVDLYVSCRAQAYHIWPRGNVEPGVGRGREFLFNACVLNRGTIPGRPLW